LVNLKKEVVKMVDVISREIKEALIETIGEKDAELLLLRIKNEREGEFLRIFVNAIYDFFGYQQGRRIIAILAYNLQRRNSPYSKKLLRMI
jgi:hypothetical protein